MVRGPAGTQTLARGLGVLGAVAAGVTDLRGIVAYTAIGRSTAHRLIQLLVQEGYLRVIPEHEYGLGSKLIELGFKALEANPLTSVAARYLEGLSAQVHDTVHLAIEDQESVLYLAKIPGTRGAEMRSRIGLRMPMTRTGIGKALLLDSPERWERLYSWESPVDTSAPGSAVLGDVEAFVARMRDYARRGAAYDLEENEPGVRCIAAPVRDATGAICAALSVAATRPYMPSQRMRSLVPVVRQAAESISSELGFRPHPAGS